MPKFYARVIRVLYSVVRPLSHAFLHNSRRVRVIVRADNKVLLVRSAVGSQRWNLPGGGVKKGENALLSAQRELYEETSLKLATSQLHCLGEERLSLNKQGSGKPYAAIVFYDVACPEAAKLRIRRPLEILEVDWFPIATLPPNVNPQVTRGMELAAMAAKP